MAKWGSCDFRQLKRLQKKMEKFEQVENEEFCEMCAKHLAARLLSRVIKRTPVDSGTLRRGWTNGEEHVKKDKNGKERIVGIGGDNGFASKIEVEHKGNEFVCEIVNSTSYAIYVEYGHRTRNHNGWVNGRFMLEKSTLELDNQAPKIIEKMLMKKLGEIFNDQ